MNVMLMAAGEGTRLRPFTNILPKPAMPFLNIPLAAHSLGFLNEISLDKLVVNTFHLPGKIHSLFQTLPHQAKELIFSDEVGEILGSGGGLGKARNHFIGGGDFLMMNADEIILPVDPFIARKAMQRHQDTKALATILVMDHPGVGIQFGGVWADDSNQVRGFGKTQIPGATKAWHFIGAQILSEKVFQYIPTQGASNILYDALTAGIAAGEKVQIFKFNCSWFETGNPADFMKATSECLTFLSSAEKSFQKDQLERNLQRFAPAKVLSQKIGNAELCFSQDAQIDTAAILKGFICCGSQSELPSNCDLENVVIGANVKVPAGTKAANTLLI